MHADERGTAQFGRSGGDERSVGRLGFAARESEAEIICQAAALPACLAATCAAARKQLELRLWSL